MNDALVLEIVRIMLWGLIATIAITSISFASQGLGWSRLNFPLLLGSMFTSERKPAMVLGFILYLLIGWLIAMVYYVIIALIGQAGVLVGLGLALIHAIFLLVVGLPLLPHIHPRMASVHDGPSRQRRLEPPGFLALHYGPRTPIVVIIAYLVYGAILGWAYQPH